MTLQNAKETGKNKVEMSFVIDRAVFLAAVDAVYKKSAKKISIPGFRKGKAPKSIIEKFYGKGVFYEDAINDILPAEIEKAIAETKFECADTPSVTDVDFEAEEGVVVKAEFVRKPDVKLGDYKAIKAVKKTVAATDKDVEEELARVQKRNSRTVKVENEAAKNGDIAVIDYEGFVDGVAFEGGKDSGHRLTLGSGTFIPGFEDQIVGKNAGEEFDVNVKFPEDYHAENLKGKDATFKVKLNAIEKEELPELDDEFAKDVSEFDTLDEYKKDILAKIEKRNADEADMRLGEDLAAALCELVEADIPEVMFEKEKDYMLREYDMQLRRQGLNLDMIIQYTGMKVEDLRERYADAAVVNVKKQLALAEIVKLEKIEATAEDLSKRYEELAAEFGMKADDVKARIPEEDIKNEVAILKAFELVKNSAKITEKTVTEDELASEKAEKAVAAKKPAAKKTTTAKKTTAKAEDAAEKKPAAKKTTAKKTAEKAEGEKPAAKKTTTAKKTTAKAEGEKKPAAKKTTAKKEKAE